MNYYASADAYTTVREFHSGEKGESNFVVRQVERYVVNY